MITKSHLHIPMVQLKSLVIRWTNVTILKVRTATSVVTMPIAWLPPHFLKLSVVLVRYRRTNVRRSSVTATKLLEKVKLWADDNRETRNELASLESACDEVPGATETEVRYYSVSEIEMWLLDCLVLFRATPIINCILTIFFSNPQLMVYLAGNGIMSLGTVRSNRVPKCITISDFELKTRGRGSYVESWLSWMAYKLRLCAGLTIRPFTSCQPP